MKTDLDRLHKVIENRKLLFGARQTGRTFAACHNAAGLLETSPPNSLIIWLIPKFDWIHHIRAMLQSILEEHEIKVLRVTQQRLYFDDGKEIRFISMADPEWQTQLRGREYHVVDDLGEADDFARNFIISSTGSPTP